MDKKLKLINKLISNFKTDNVVILSITPFRVMINNNEYEINDTFTVTEIKGIFSYTNKNSNLIEEKIKN